MEPAAADAAAAGGVRDAGWMARSGRRPGQMMDCCFSLLSARIRYIRTESSEIVELPCKVPPKTSTVPGDNLRVPDNDVEWKSESKTSDLVCRGLVSHEIPSEYLSPRRRTLAFSGFLTDLVYLEPISHRIQIDS